MKELLSYRIGSLKVRINIVSNKLLVQWEFPVAGISTFALLRPAIPPLNTSINFMGIREGAK